MGLLKISILLLVSAISTRAVSLAARQRRDTIVVIPDHDYNRTIIIEEPPSHFDYATNGEPGKPEDNALAIYADNMDYDTGSVIIREGKKLMINCEFEKVDVVRRHDISWKKEGGSEIDDGGSPSLFSLTMTSRITKFPKSALHFTSVHKRDGGVYVCIARTVGGEFFESKVLLQVLPHISWVHNETIVGGLIGEPLTVNCDVSRGDGKHQLIQMTNGDGEPLDETIWKVAGNEATIESLQKEHVGLMVSCTTVEMYDKNRKEGFPVIDRKDTAIEVYHPPEFATEESVQYTVIDDNDREVFIHCNITESIPIAKHFTFYHNDQLVNASSRHNILRDVGIAQGAHLHIRHVDESDLGSYRCEASNGKAKAHHIIHLREANPPPEPRVTLIATSKHSITWKIESVEQESSMPTTAIEIRHLRASQADSKVRDDDDGFIPDSVWKFNGILTQQNINKEGVYEIKGLRHAHEYVWRFREINEAGFGDSVVIRAKTFDENDIVPDSSSTFTVLFSFIVTFIFFNF